MTEKKMALLVVLGAVMLGIVSWLIWSIVVCIVFLAAVGIPWGIWELFMYLTFNNIINAFAKLPSFIGGLLGFVLTLPFAAVAVVVSIWAYIQTFLMGILTFRGFYGDFAQSFIKTCVEPFEEGWPKSFIIARYYYEHCQWLWGGASCMYSYFPWQNGCGKGWVDGSDFWWPVCQIPVPFMCIKLLLLGLPYMAMFVLPLIPIIWSITRPFVGAFSALPAVSGNGDGRD